MRGLHARQPSARTVTALMALLGIVVLAYFRFALASPLAACAIDCVIEQYNEQTGTVSIGYDEEQSMLWAFGVLDASVAHEEGLLAVALVVATVVLCATIVVVRRIALMALPVGVSPPVIQLLRKGIRGGRLSMA